MTNRQKCDIIYTERERETKKSLSKRKEKEVNKMNAYLNYHVIHTLETASETPCPVWVAVILCSALGAIIIAMIAMIIKTIVSKIIREKRYYDSLKK